MAFRTNKVPAVEERTVSGSSVSFNSAFALPLKKCEVSFSATQAGSGDPSPSNPRAISGVSAIVLTANSTPVSVSFGNTKYGGELDLLTGVLTVTHKRSADISTLSWGRVTTPEWNCFYTTSLGDKKAGTTNIICEVAKTAYFYNMPSIDNAVMGNGVNVNCYIRDTSFNLDVNAFKQAYAGYYLYYELAEPITIQLSPTQLSTIEGNNTFSTDTGTLEITFADLQEKSASGAVASFNTALAMPLVECKTEFMCTEIGTGEKSPSNPYTLVGVDEVHINMVNFNQYIDERTDYDTPQIVNGVTISRNGKAFTFSGDCVAESLSSIPLNNSCSIFTPNDIYLAICFKSGWSGQNENWRIFKNGTGTNIYGGNSEYRLFRLPSNWVDNSWIMSVPLVNGKHYDFTFYPQMFNLTQMFGSKMAEQILTAEQGQEGNGYAMFRQLFYKSWYDYNVGGTWVSIASVNGDTFPDYCLIDLDGTRYGGYVDVVRKKLVIDRTIFQYTNQQCYAGVQYIKSDACASYIFNNNIYPLKPASQQSQQLCDKLKFSTASIWAYVGYVNQWVVNQNSIIVNIANDLIGVTDPSQETTTSVASKIRDYLMVEKPIFTIPIEPIEIDLSDIPTLSTIIGNNSFASDSGSIELKYKDLDIAKRGNFREVFRLPS